MSANPGPDHNISGLKILLDSPTQSPALGYREIGRGLATIISDSEPQFAIGVFGGWGTGKTTLMAAIKTALPKSSVITVDFNAWRYEREPQLLIPLLDTIRAELVKWSDDCSANAESKVCELAGRIGKVARALATGLSVEVGLPGAVKVSYEAGKAIEQLSQSADPCQPQSLYAAAFRELAAAFSGLEAQPFTRIVVFVDDLDRCLPANALEVLESIKMFFDLPGFIFVVGLDQQVVMQAIRSKFETRIEQPGGLQTTSSSSAAADLRLGREYVKKIFQLSFSLPPVLPGQLDELLQSMYRESSLGSAQVADFESLMRPYLGYVAVDRRVNPREVKRFVNAYTLQVLVRPDLRRDTILALQTLAFRDEWQDLYDAMLTDTDMFIEILRRYRKVKNSEQGFADLAPSLNVLPASLTSYLRSDLAAPLLNPESLDPYVSSLQSTSGAPSWIAETYTAISDIRHQLRSVLSAVSPDKEIVDAIAVAARVLADTVLERTSGHNVTENNQRLQQILEHISHTAHQVGSVADRSDLSGASDVNSALMEMQGAIDELRSELKSIRDFSILLP
jgi:hypothetical protein